MILEQLIIIVKSLQRACYVPETALGNVYLHLISHSTPINLGGRHHFPDEDMRLSVCPSHGWRGGNGEGRGSQTAEGELLALKPSFINQPQTHPPT